MNIASRGNKKKLTRTPPKVLSLYVYNGPPKRARARATTTQNEIRCCLSDTRNGVNDYPELKQKIDGDGIIFDNNG